MKPTEYSLARAFKRIEEELIKSMIRNFEKHKAEETEEGFNWDQWQVVQLRELEKYRKQNAKRFDEEFKDLNSQIDELLRMTNDDAQTEQEHIILDQIKKGNFEVPEEDPGLSAELFAVNEEKLNALVDSTTKDLEKAEHAVLRRSNDIYRQVINDAQVYAVSGGTYEQAIDMATKDFAMRGIRSIVYKNGARHTIEDYASMAIRTAGKRAYLMGEGKKHAEYGIHTVRVAKRTDACPLCLRWTGKVLIDDVYSGGTKQEAREKRLPLLSTAMAKGLYHPNCRDVHSLYIEGVSKPAEPWSEYDLKVLADKYNYEQKEKHAKTMLQGWTRVAETRLDPENKKKAEARVQEWKDRLGQIEDDQNRFYGNRHLPLMAAKSGGYEDLKPQGLDAHYAVHSVDFNNYMWEHHPEFFGSRADIDQAIRDYYQRQYATELYLAQQGDSMRAVDMHTYRSTPGAMGTMFPEFESYKDFMYENSLHMFAQPGTMFETFVTWEKGASPGGYGKAKGARAIFDLETGLSDFIDGNLDLHYNGDTLYRGIMTSKSEIDKLYRSLKKGTPIDMRGASSWSTRPGVAKTFTDYSLRKNTQKVIFVEEGIHPRNAIPFPYSSTIHASGMLQNEVIYSGSVEFDIIDITEKEGIYYVRVRERL